VGSLTTQLKAEGDALAAKGEFEAAVDKYQAALNQEPTELTLHYAIGYALSHLGRRAETVEHFRWVVDHGPPDAPEVTVARSWLVNAGERASGAEGAEAATAARNASGPKGMVKGETEWKGISADNSPYLLELVLWGDDAATRGNVLTSYVKLGTPYIFENVRAGAYRFTGRWGYTELWDVRVTAEANRETVLNLSPANSLVSVEAFPRHYVSQRPPQKPGRVSRPGGEAPPSR